MIKDINSIPEGNPTKKGDPKASFFVYNVPVNYFTMNFWVSEPALTK